MTEKQRTVSGIGGGFLFALGIFGFGSSSFHRALRMTAGSLLLMRAITGYCPVTAMKNKTAGDATEKPKNMVTG